MKAVSTAEPPVPRFALALGGGAARGLAHLGVMEVLEREELRPTCIVGTSMGAIVGALHATGLPSSQMVEIARSFSFPRRFVPGGIVRWDSLFGAAADFLHGYFEDLATPLYVTAVNIESGNQMILHRGKVLPAIQASSSVPGVMPPVRIGRDWLVDGGIVNVLPVDVAWVAEPDVVVAVDLGGARQRRLRYLDWPATRVVSRLGELLPNPVTAKISFEMMVRATEIMLDRQTTLATAMTRPDLLLRPELGSMGLRDFDRLDDAVAAGRAAAQEALPTLRELLAAAQGSATAPRPSGRFYFDPVCAMVISPARARATVEHGGATYRFCSVNCSEAFAHDPEAYLGAAASVASSGPPPGGRAR